MSSEAGGRVTAARRRARAGKVAFAAFAAVVFGAGMVLTRNTASGHIKHGVRPLAAPHRFIRTVERNALQAGQLAPPQAAPPQASTSQS